MKDPQELSQEALAAIVGKAQAILYRDEDERGQFWNREKEWACVDMLIELSDVLAQYDLAPPDIPERRS